MSRPVNIYELLDDDSNENKGQKGPVAQKPKTQTTTTTQAKASTQQVNRSAPARNQDRNQDRKPREEGRFGDQQVSDRAPRGDRERKPTKGGEFTEVRAPRNPNQRQYDRKSGTGRGRENKRAGGGRGNWGSVSDETKTQEETEKVEAEVAPTTEAAPATETTEAVAEDKVEEEEEKVKTLDEYLGTIKKVSISLPAPRQAGEGQEVSPQWASYTALKRDEEEEKKTTEKKPVVAKEPTKQTISADQVIHFKESPKGERSFRGGRGGRGGRRGGAEGSPRGGRSDRAEGSPRGERGGRGGRRGGNPGARAPGLTEENFPALKA